MTSLSSRPKPKTWFEELFGAPEKPKDVAALFTSSTDADGNICLTSSANHRTFVAGKFTTPTLANLRNDCNAFLRKHHNTGTCPAKITITHKAVNDILGCHADHPSIATTFQAASQFNCLEFPGSNHIPELGITDYVYDNTQGPACAVACAAGTVYRNYFIPLDETTPGQTTKRQLNTLDKAESYLNGSNSVSSGCPYWTIKNGYIFSDTSKLSHLTQLLQTRPTIAATLRDQIKVGIQANTEVLMKNRSEPLDTSATRPHVTQVYCSAVSCSYSGISARLWTAFAQVVLDAAYESTLWAALLHSGTPTTTNYKVYLTFIGGGAFGNDMDWIIQSMARAIKVVNAAFKSVYDVQLEIIVCHYRFINTDYVNKLAGLVYSQVPAPVPAK